MKTHLPVVETTAASTAFCTAQIDGPGGLHLFADGNGKITASNGTLADPRPNAFSLVQIETCPGSTTTCRSACYVHQLEVYQRPTHDLYRHNTDTIKTILADRALANDWAMRMAGWITENCSGGFRWHVSGDVFSLEYAEWIRDVCREAPSVRFWIYTRSFGFLWPLREVAANGPNHGNLALNISCDRDNWDAAVYAANYFINGPDGEPDGPYTSRLCYLTIDGSLPPHAGDPDTEDCELGSDDVIFPDYQLRPRQFATLAESPWWTSLKPAQRGLVCPADSFGKAENRRCGPCHRCLD
jgi:hypothetical protein